MSDGDFEQLGASYGEPSPQSEQIAQLESRLQSEIDNRNEERFVAALIAIILLDIGVFDGMESWAGPISILVLELFLLIVLAQKCGLDVVELWIDKVLGSLKGMN